jgi:hypothetical protein
MKHRIPGYERYCSGDVISFKDVKEANIGDYPTPCKEKEFNGTWE